MIKNVIADIAMHEVSHLISPLGARIPSLDCTFLHCVLSVAKWQVKMNKNMMAWFCDWLGHQFLAKIEFFFAMGLRKISSHGYWISY